MMSVSTQRGVPHSDETLDSDPSAQNSLPLSQNKVKKGQTGITARGEGEDDNEKFCKETLQDFATGLKKRKNSESKHIRVSESILNAGIKYKHPKQQLSRDYLQCIPGMDLVFMVESCVKEKKLFTYTLIGGSLVYLMYF